VSKESPSAPELNVPLIELIRLVFSFSFFAVDTNTLVAFFVRAVFRPADFVPVQEWKRLSSPLRVIPYFGGS